MNKQLAKITSAGLEIKERGILNFWIFVDYEDGGSQGVAVSLCDYSHFITFRYSGNDSVFPVHPINHH